MFVVSVIVEGVQGQATFRAHTGSVEITMVYEKLQLMDAVTKIL